MNQWILTLALHGNTLGALKHLYLDPTSKEYDLINLRCGWVLRNM